MHDQTTFYITDSSAFRNRVLYFRQDDWEVLCRPLLDRLAATTFEQITQVEEFRRDVLSHVLADLIYLRLCFMQHEAEELLQQRKLGFSFVRLLPKDTGVRPIVNLRRRRRKLAVCFSFSSLLMK